jgi:hypothetical protein
MMKLILLAALAFGPSFAEKTGTSHPKLAQPPAMEGCDASELGPLVGQQYDEALKARAQEGSGAATVRVFHTGDPITQDVRSDRLNLELAPHGKVLSVRCF